MLLEYSVTNFGPFKETASIILKPEKVLKRFQNNIIMEKNIKGLKGAVIVGENAGGKTGFMRSLHYLQYLFSKEGRIVASSKLLCRYQENKSQKFRIVVAIEGIIYTYNLEIDTIGIVSEALEMKKAASRKKENEILFRMNRLEVNEKEEKKEEGSLLKKRIVKIAYELDMTDNPKLIDESIYKIIQENTNDNYTGLYIKYLGAIGVKCIRPFIEWIQEKLIVELPGDHNLNFYKKVEKNEEDIEIISQESYFEIFKLVDSTIVRIEVNEEQPFEKSLIVRKDQNEQEFKIELEYESSGTREFFAWAIQLWKVLYRNCTLFADEVDRVLNVVLSQKVVALINGSEHKGQFIFSTHNVLHLDTNNYMKEQLYFVSKDRETLTSEIYSLSEFKEYRYDKWDVYDLYLRGILGGTPNE